MHLSLFVYLPTSVYLPIRYALSTYLSCSIRLSVSSAHVSVSRSPFIYLALPDYLPVCLFWLYLASHLSRSLSILSVFLCLFTRLLERSASIRIFFCLLPCLSASFTRCQRMHPSRSLSFAMSSRIRRFSCFFVGLSDFSAPPLGRPRPRIRWLIRLDYPMCLFAGVAVCIRGYIHECMAQEMSTEGVSCRRVYPCLSPSFCRYRPSPSV